VATRVRRRRQERDGDAFRQMHTRSRTDGEAAVGRHFKGDVEVAGVPLPGRGHGSAARVTFI